MTTVDESSYTARKLERRFMIVAIEALKISYDHSQFFKITICLYDALKRGTNQIQSWEFRTTCIHTKTADLINNDGRI